MRCIEYGRDRPETILLLHGGGLSWWNYREEAEILQEWYHVVLPILDGHAGSDRPFTSIEDNAAEIIAYIDEHFGGKVLFMGGLSLGGQILLDILARRRSVCRYAFVESAMAIPSKITHALIAPAFGSSYGLIRNRQFAILQFRSLHMREELFEDYYRDTCRIAKSDMIAFMKANTAYTSMEALRHCRAEVHLFIGGKETPGIRRSAERLHKQMPNSSLSVLPGYYHGEFSVNHPQDYAAYLRETLQKETVSSDGPA
ncbi:MAG: alpha/beta hydrolase [Clostridia bacterium]|nr:alpha/beta hydrolase [Clostridia bacterium]